MDNQSKKDIHSAIIAGLQSQDQKVVLESINQLREEGKPEDIFSLLNLLLVNYDHEIHSSVLSLLADIKEQKSGSLFIEAINEEKYSAIRKNLVEICWESSIDFTEFISTFVDLLIQSDFEIAFEAFTVIENMAGNISDDAKLFEKSKLKDAIASVSEDKKGMLHEAIHIIDQL